MPNIIDHIIRISGDNRKLKNTLKDSDQLLKGSSRLTQNYAKILQGALESANKKLSEVSKNLKSVEDIKAFKEQAKHVRELRQELEQIQKTQRMPTAGGAGMGGAASGGRGAMGFLKSVPGIGGLLTLGGMFGIGMAAFRQRAATAGTGLRLRGLGAAGGSRSNIGLGFGPQENLQQRLALTQMVGGGGGLEDAQAMARATGLDTQQLIGAAGARRRVGLGQAESLQAVRRSMSILSETIGKTLDKGRVAEFLSSMDSSLTMLGSGIRIDEDSFTRAFGGLLRQDFFRANPERAGKALRGMDTTFRTATGARFGFVSQVMARAMQNAGQNIDPLSIMFQTRRGMFGQGGPGANKIFGALQGQLGQLGFGGSDERSSQARALFMSRQFGIQDIDVAKEVGDAIASGQFEQAQKLGKAIKTPEQYQAEALKIMESTDGRIKTQEALLESILDEIGSTIAPAVTAIAQKIAGYGGMQSDRQIEDKLVKDEKRSSMRLIKKLEMPGFGHTSRSEQTDAFFRTLSPSRKGVTTPEQREKMKAALQQEIKEGKSLLEKSPGLTEAGRDRIEELIGFLKEMVAAVDRANEREINVVINNKFPNGRTHQVTKKNIGKAKQ